MPKRSNDFQKLVYLARLNLAGGAKVTESKMMRDRLTKSYREVDVVIEGSVAGQDVVISIECRDHKRVSDVTWVEAMKSKHDRLKTNALILASSNGFTKESRLLSEKYGIELISLDNFEDDYFSNFFKEKNSLFVKTVTATIKRVEIFFSINETESEYLNSNPDNLVYFQDGQIACEVKEIAEHLVKSDRLRDFIFDEGRADHTWFEIISENPRGPEGKSLYMKKIEPETLRQIKSIRITGPCQIQIGRFSMRKGKLGNISVAWGKSMLGDKEAIAVATETSAGQNTISITFA